MRSNYTFLSQSKVDWSSHSKDRTKIGVYREVRKLLYVHTYMARSDRIDLVTQILSYFRI